jgi:hypothetical protein
MIRADVPPDVLAIIERERSALAARGLGLDADGRVYVRLVPGEPSLVPAPRARRAADAMRSERRHT